MFREDIRSLEVKDCSFVRALGNVLKEKHEAKAKADHRLFSRQVLAELFWCTLKSELCLNEKWIIKLAVNDRDSVIEKGNISALLGAEE